MTQVQLPLTNKKNNGPPKGRKGNTMIYGQELIEQLERENELNRKAIDNRFERIANGWTDMDDCFVSQHFEERGIANNEQKIELIKDGGCAWFVEYATLDNQLIEARWCNTKYGLSLRAVLPDGKVVWTTACTQKGLARKGIKKVECKRPAWYEFKSAGRGMCGAYAGHYVLCPSDVNYATGEDATEEPLEINWDIED